MTGIIDIGSNTVRLVVYDDAGRKISNTALNSEIIQDTHDGVLSEIGIKKLCESIAYLKKTANEIPVYAFATYAVRVLKNKEEVKEKILRENGIKTDILSGEDEGRYVFCALKSSLSAGESGICVDLGGGSGEVMIFKENEPVLIRSYPIGCRKIKNELGTGVFPSNEEKKKIKDYVKNRLEKFSADGNLYIMGGTAKTSVKLYRFLCGGENTDVMSAELLDRMIDFIGETPEKYTKSILENRYDNIATGIVIIQAIAEFYGKDKICVKQCGVRDGYLKEITKKEP